MPGSHKWEDSPQYKALGSKASLRKRQMAYAAWQATNFPKPKEKHDGKFHMEMSGKTFHPYGKGFR